MVVVVEETVLQYPYFEDEEKKKELHLLYDIQNRIAKQIKTVTTINYIKHDDNNFSQWGSTEEWM